LDVIASGPTVADTATPREAIHILERYSAKQAGVSPAVFEFLDKAAQQPCRGDESTGRRGVNLVIGNNAVAVDAAGAEAERRGYSHAMIAARRAEGPAEEVGRNLADAAARMQCESGPDCLISGGEPVVQLVPPERRGLGGRNQQLVLAALDRLLNVPHAASRGEASLPCQGMALLSGGTDGEDGPTDAAGAFIDERIAAAACERKLVPSDFLCRNDAYHFFEPLGALLRTGPTHTNVCDVRVAVVSREEASAS
jgi:hydroxypyruvate reductase